MVIDSLLNKGADVNCADEKKGSPLYAAVCNGKPQYVKKLLAMGARVDQDCQVDRRCSKLTHLAISILEGSSPHELLAYGVDFGVACDMCPNTLMAAVYGGKPENVRFLIANGTDVNQLDFAGRTPLHRATQLGNEDVIDTLRSHGSLGQHLEKLSPLELRPASEAWQQGCYKIPEVLTLTSTASLRFG